ncbi:MAG: carbon starvation protein A [Elusimicrobia bacterium]|nr:carbon starvation protein A [Elusimicrobiota bacterium]
MIALIVLSITVVFAVAYRSYGRVLARVAGLRDEAVTPACRINDGMDFVPTSPVLLLGQHFSAIAAAGPIVGPILACLWFGWAPALAWIVLGAVFVGGSHDFFSLVASLRQDGRSIGVIIKDHVSPLAYRFFLVFVWLTLIYVIIAFTDITAATFKGVVDGEMFGAAVAGSSGLYLLAALVMGLGLRFGRWGTGAVTAVFVPVVLFIIWAGPHLPLPVLEGLNAVSLKQWDLLILGYCFVASVIPVWLLLQPRGYLGGWLLYLVMAVGLLGALLSGYPVQFPAFHLEGFKSAVNGGSVFPLLFITIACGACSGFHGIVSSGTTSKQIAKESHALPIGMGAMLLEGLVAVLAVVTVMILPLGSLELTADPNVIYARGIARYLGMLGIDPALALSFALLAFSTFVYDTLDVCTRLARYIFEEFFHWEGRRGASFLATAVSLLVPAGFLLSVEGKGYLIFWTVFGASNQLLASLVLLAITVWLKAKGAGRGIFVTLFPMVFMMIMTLWALVDIMRPGVLGLWNGGITAEIALKSASAGVLFVLAIVLTGMALRALWPRSQKARG